MSVERSSEKSTNLFNALNLLNLLNLAPMSRLAKKPITFPAGVSVTLDNSTLVFTGPKGALDCVLPPAVSALIEGNTLTLSSTSRENQDFAQWGLMWALVQSRMQGVSAGFTKSLEIQ